MNTKHGTFEKDNGRIAMWTTLAGGYFSRLISLFFCQLPGKKKKILSYHSRSRFVHNKNSHISKSRLWYANSRYVEASWECGLKPKQQAFCRWKFDIHGSSRQNLQGARQRRLWFLPSCSSLLLLLLLMYAQNQKKSRRKQSVHLFHPWPIVLQQAVFLFRSVRCSFCPKWMCLPSTPSLIPCFLNEWEKVISQSRKKQGVRKGSRPYRFSESTPFSIAFTE